ncbi:LOW QUALITY PROTEIN: protein shisa-9B [Phyllopteryx taeniolatus]|uniref:LOW QUALITY PROTEIN: protein shisa-9B n=1 Tax=Phyllopteryx taeniolatus TaxID=161469 RepID=UPI002AD47478|nr:LOW QUALITY PROTEIN: protein shisa-9B [Phyllopteryx taeniolatus]
MRGAELLLAYVLAKVTVRHAEGQGERLADELVLVSGYNESEESTTSSVTESPHTEDKCRGYYDVMGQWDPPFVCQTGNYLYCCGTCGFRFCCAFRSSRLDQTTCKNYDTPPWMMTGRPPSKVDVAQDSAKDKTNMIVYVICGLVAIVALIGIFTKLGLEKTQRLNRDNMPRTLAHVIRHPASEHTDEMSLGLHYENMQTRVAINSLHSHQMNNATPAPLLLTEPYALLDQISSPYEPQTPVKDLIKYATLKAVAEKANDSFYTNRRQVLSGMTAKGSLPMEHVDTEPEPSNPYSPPRQMSTKQSGRRHKSPRSHSSQSLSFGSFSTPATPRPWESTDVLGLRQCYGPTKLCVVERELQNIRYLPPQPYFVTNSKTEVTV